MKSKSLLFLCCFFVSLYTLPSIGSAAEPKLQPPTYAEVHYGPHERNVLDFWQAEGKGPRPLLVFIHGGGWTNGNKSRWIKPETIRPYLKRGISFATINYRLTSEAILPAPVHDAARAIQFLRTKSKEWNINGQRIALTGGSAGACTSMWILLHDDLADPNSEDPVLRESTRVIAAAVSQGQVSLDPKVIDGWLGPNVLKHRMVYLSVGAKSTQDALANYEQYRDLYYEFSPYNHLDKNDPPLFMEYKMSMSLPSVDGNHGIHHPVYGVKMKEKADRMGHECHLVIKDVSKPGRYRNQGDFLKTKLLEEK